MSLYGVTGFSGAGESNTFTVQSVGAGVLTANVPIVAPKCSGNKKWELRRPGVAGIAEFGGMVASIQGKQVRHSLAGVKNPPKKGDRFIVYCADQGGSSSKGGGGDRLPPLKSTILPGEEGMGIPVWLILIGGGLLLFIVLKK